MRALPLIIATVLTLAGCYRPPPRADGAQMSLWNAEQNEKIALLQHRVNQLELKTDGQMTLIQDLQAQGRSAAPDARRAPRAR